MSERLYSEDELRVRVFERAGVISARMASRLQEEGFERIEPYQVQGQLQPDGTWIFDGTPFMAECQRQMNIFMHVYVEALMATLFDIDYEEPPPRLRLVGGDT